MSRGLSHPDKSIFLDIIKCSDCGPDMLLYSNKKGRLTGLGTADMPLSSAESAAPLAAEHSKVSVAMLRSTATGGHSSMPTPHPADRMCVCVCVLGE